MERHQSATYPAKSHLHYINIWPHHMIKDNSFKIHSLLHSSYSLCTMSYTGCNTLKYFSHLLITGSFPISTCHHQLSSFPRITDTIINLLSNCTYFCITVTLHSNYCSSATLNSLFHCILHILLNSDILPLPSSCLCCSVKTVTWNFLQYLPQS